MFDTKTKETPLKKFYSIFQIRQSQNQIFEGNIFDAENEITLTKSRRQCFPTKTLID